MEILQNIEQSIICIQNQNVIIDSDVARLYGVETKRINEAVKNNPEKFPDGYIIELSEYEWKQLKSNISTSIKGGKVKIPKAFTEKGLYMLATILKSPQATETTLAIVETFAKIRELQRNVQTLSQTHDEQTKKEIMQKTGTIINQLFDNDMNYNESETTIEINFAVLKLKHTIKGKK
ncbi:MAG: ORF6N domain protein [Bacteroidetes bacterium ADurb.Bin217]|nr:MAG: ORF6N domain protein [Bacteroidetes bacterium ADurb.Bin217]